MQERLAEAEPIVVTTTADGEHVARLPLPHRAYFSAAFLGMLAGEVFETVIETRFANGTARWRVIGANEYGVLVAERIGDEVGAGGPRRLSGGSVVTERCVSAPLDTEGAPSEDGHGDDARRQASASLAPPREAPRAKT